MPFHAAKTDGSVKRLVLCQILTQGTLGAVEEPIEPRSSGPAAEFIPP